MDKDLIVIVSSVPERISKYSQNLRPLTSGFLFFSELTSLLEETHHANLRLIILDNVDGCGEVVPDVRTIRSLERFEAVPVVLICKDKGCEDGIEALSTGANDYLSFSVVDKELAVRARMHMNAQEARTIHLESNVDLKAIYPLEDRAIVRRALWYIHNNTALLKKIEDLTVYVGSSASDINNSFSKHLGKTAFQYIREVKINKAKNMLLKTRLPITHISEELGYSSSANFSTAFKSVVGLTPNEYRKSSVVN